MAALTGFRRCGPGVRFKFRKRYCSTTDDAQDHRFDDFYANDGKRKSKGSVPSEKPIEADEESKDRAYRYPGFKASLCIGDVEVKEPDHECKRDLAH
jgi:hypothetical protein